LKIDEVLLKSQELYNLFQMKFLHSTSRETNLECVTAWVHKSWSRHDGFLWLMDLTKKKSSKKISSHTEDLKLFQQGFKHISSEWRSASLEKESYCDIGLIKINKRVTGKKKSCEKTREIIRRFSQLKKVVDKHNHGFAFVAT